MRAVTRADHQRRQGTLGEIDTVTERLERVESVLARRQLLVWRRIMWWIEQQRQQAALLPSRFSGPMARTIDGLDDDLAEMDALIAEARGETAGALAHLGNVVAAVRIDQFLADQMRLANAGLSDGDLDAFVNGGVVPLEAAS